MPYIVTTITPSGWRGPDVFDGVTRTTRRAVATLDEARDAAIEATGGAYSIAEHNRTLDQAAAFTEAGGTIGPLPDGTVIEVSPFQPNVPDWRAEEIVNAFNAR